MNWLLEGLASIFDFTGIFTMRRSHDILERSDAEALRGDWEAVGNDMKTVLGHKQRQRVLEPIDHQRRQYVTSKLSYFKDTLATCPPGASLMRISLESNIKACEEELKTGMRVRWQ